MASIGYLCLRTTTILRIRRWKELATAAVAILVVRVVLELPICIRRSFLASQVMSAVTTDLASQLRDVQPRPEELDIDLFAVDLKVDYPVYVPSLPRFVSVDDRRSFIGDSDNRVYLAVPPAGAPPFTGRVRVVSNGVIWRNHECSWKTSDDEFNRLDDDGRSAIYVNRTVCPLLVPDGHTFQHFVDGVLPKLVQLLTEAPRLAAAVDTFVVYRPRDAVISEMLNRVGVTRQRLMLVAPPTSGESSPLLEARRLVDTCVTPSVHPRLWRRASHLLLACEDRGNQDAHRRTSCLRSDRQRTTNSDLCRSRRRLGDAETVDVRHTERKFTNTSRSLIVLLSRRWTRNGGRRLLNENAVFDYLVDRFGRQRVARFGNGRVDLTTATALFSRAGAIVGVHGGAFYNIILAPSGCVVVELMPLVTRPGQLAAPPRRLAHTIVWRMADALGHIYWRVYSTTSSPRHDVSLAIDNLRSALTTLA